MKKIGLAVMTLSLAVATACSNEETSAPKEKVEKTEEKASASKNEETTTEMKSTEKESKAEELNLIEAIPVKKRNAVLFENEHGKITLIGESINSEGNLLAAIKLEGELKNTELPYINLKFISDKGDDYTLDNNTLKSYRVEKNSNILVYEASSEIEGTKLVRLDYSFNSEDALPEEGEFKNLVLKDTEKEAEIPALKMITEYSYSNLDIQKENKDYKIKIKDMSLDATEGDSVTFSGTIESKKDLNLEEEAVFTRPYINESGQASLETSQSQLYKGVPVDFTLTVNSDYLFGKDKGSIINLSFEDMAFGFNVATGKEYKGPFTLQQLPLTASQDYDYIGETGAEGFTDVSGKTYYNVIESSPFWNHGITDTSQRADFQYILDNRFKTLKFKVGAGELYKDKGGNYDFYIYGDDFDKTGEGDPTGTPLLHEKITSSSPMKEYELDVSGVKRLVIYYQTNQKAPGIFSEEDEDKGKVQMLIADTELK